jgi:UMF1 family MFS transporter
MDIFLLSLFSDQSDLGFRVVIVATAAWWILVGFLPLMRLPKPHTPPRKPTHCCKWLGGYAQFVYSILVLRKVPHTGIFLLANMLYSDGLWTVGSIMSTFGHQELHMSEFQLGICVLLFQVMGCIGCFFFEALADRHGTRFAIVVSLFIYIGLCIYSLIALTSVLEFFVVVSLGALATGGCAALSRSLFSLFIPVGLEAEFFSIYEITDRGTAWLGPLVFGVVNQVTSSMRLGILSLVFFFVGGLIFLFKVDVKRATEDAVNLRLDVLAAQTVESRNAHRDVQMEIGQISNQIGHGPSHVQPSTVVELATTVPTSSGSKPNSAGYVQLQE